MTELAADSEHSNYKNNISSYFDKDFFYKNFTNFQIIFNTPKSILVRAVQSQTLVFRAN